MTANPTGDARTRDRIARPAATPLLLISGFLTIAAAALAIVGWLSIHPLPMHWDEANYLTHVHDDAAAFHAKGAEGLVKEWFWRFRERPPGYRMAAAPLTLTSGPSLASLRLLSIFSSALAIAFIGAAAGRNGGATLAVLAAAIAASMPEFVRSAAWFGTEFLLFLSVGILLFGLIREKPLLIALGTALGCFSKISFAAIAFPAIAAAVLYDRRIRLGLWAAAGGLFAAPWWFVNWDVALQYARYGATGERWTVPYDFLIRLREVTNGIGVLTGVAILIAASAVGRMEKGDYRAAIIALAATIPSLAAAAIAPVLIPRHFMPAVLPVAIFTVLAVKQTRKRLYAVAVLVLLQSGIAAVAPAEALGRIEQIDWNVVAARIADPEPRIGLFGAIPGMSPPEVALPWYHRGTRPVVSWLWRSEEATIDWDAIMAEAATMDAILLVAPGDPPSKLMKMAEDNVHNEAFLERVSKSGRFRLPELLRVGTVERHSVLLIQREGAVSP